ARGDARPPRRARVPGAVRHRPGARAAAAAAPRRGTRPVPAARAAPRRRRALRPRRRCLRHASQACEMMPRMAAPTIDETRGQALERGIEFYFAQFVDLYGRPSAKLIPAAYLDDLVSSGAGFAGFAAGELGQLPSDPDIAAMPDLASFTPVPWEPTLAR